MTPFEKQINSKLIGYWTLGLVRKGPKKWVCPSFCLSSHSSFRPSFCLPSVCLQVFLELAHQFFLKLSKVLGGEGPYLLVCDSQGFFGKPSPKMTKNGQKWPKNMVLAIFDHFCSLRIFSKQPQLKTDTKKIFL